MLEVYERKIQKMCEKYHITDIDPKEYVSDIYSSLFKDAIPTESHDALYNARRLLAERILKADNPDDFFTHLSNDEGNINLHIYANKAPKPEDILWRNLNFDKEYKFFVNKLIIFLWSFLFLAIS
ncbi:MAG: hypothetical protein II816_04380, partial [Elusimicrobia bacterium]|nr:hypothetical protein [Elusimicrobiota bacterium]